jgi:hypothetical protein
MTQETKSEKVNKAESYQLKIELAKIDYALELAKDNDYGCQIDIGGVGIDICYNAWIIPVLKKNKAEIEKFIEGKLNKYE